jgi:hypothetical protein
VSQLAIFIVAIAIASTPALPQTQDAGQQNYTGIGAGHYVRSVAEKGQFVTLEDGSRWEIDPRDRYRTVDWQADEGITVRRAQGEEGYDYELDNTDRDDGAYARYLIR